MAPRSLELTFFINCDRQKRFSQNERRSADLQNVASDFSLFWPGNLVMIFQSLVMILPRFFDFERPQLSPQAKVAKCLMIAE